MQRKLNHKESAELLAEEINTISELVLGYREGSYPEIIQAISRIKVTASKHIKNKKVEDLYSLIDDLTELKESIIS